MDSLPINWSEESATAGTQQMLEQEVLELVN